MTDFNNELGTAPICRKLFYERESVPVSKCYWGFTFDASTTRCVPTPENGADCSSECADQLGAECAFCPANKRYCCQKDETLPMSNPCAEATFVDLQFTEGSPTEYYQCVSPTLSVIGGSSLLEQDARGSKAHSLAQTA